MCDAATISLVATTAGTAASIAGQKKAQRAMGEAQAAENIRQGKLRDEANALFASSLSSNTAKSRSEAEATATAKRKEAYKGDLASVKRAEVGSAYGSETPKVVADESAARGEAGKMGSVIDSQNKAALAGFGDVTQGLAVKNARARSEIGTTADFMRGSASALGAEMDYASTKGDKLKTIGDILSKIGMVTGVYAATGAGATTAEELGKAGIEKGGTLTGADGAKLYKAPDGAGFFEINPSTGAKQITDVSKVNWGNYVPKEQLSWANKPAFLKPFSQAPDAEWFTRGYNIAPPKIK
jgi:hypothetical protein